MKRKQQATTSGEDYLEAILVLQMQKGTVRSVDVARHMEVSKPSVIILRPILWTASSTVRITACSAS